MIKFFRKIRQNLLMENKTGKYFKYAFGEIILVVIGILIALQINNWNESRNINNLSKTYLNSIKKDLITDTISFQAGIDRLKNSLELQEDLFNLNKVNTLPIDSLLSAIDISFHSARIYKINNSTFLKLTNSSFVESKSFSRVFIDISDYYTKEYNTWLEYLEWDKVGANFSDPEYMNEWYDKIDFRHLDKNLKTETIREQEYALAFRGYIESPRFRNFAWESNKKMTVILERMNHQKRVASELIERINNELKK